MFLLLLKLCILASGGLLCPFDKTSAFQDDILASCTAEAPKVHLSCSCLALESAFL